MTAERRVFKSVCLCACVYQTITAFSNPLMDGFTLQLTRNSNYLCSACALANNKTFKAEKSFASAAVLDRSVLRYRLLNSNHTGLFYMPRVGFK